MFENKKVANIRILSKASPKTEWEISNPTLLEREIGYELETGRYKIGAYKEDGTTLKTWNELPYASAIEVGLKTKQNGEIFNDYKNNQALNNNNHAEGTNNIAGQLGYKIYDIYQTKIKDKSNATINVIAFEIDDSHIDPMEQALVKYQKGDEIYFIQEGKETVSHEDYIVATDISSNNNSIIFINYFNGYVSVYNLNKPSWIWVAGKGKICGETINLYNSIHVEGKNNIAQGNISHAEGYYNMAYGDYSHAEGYYTWTKGKGAHAEGNMTRAFGQYSHAEGQSSKSRGDYSHAEGYTTSSDGKGSHSEGIDTTAQGNYSHAEGQGSTAIGDNGHAEGFLNYSYGDNSHSEGEQNAAWGISSHAEGSRTLTSGNYSHAEGEFTHANAQGSHVEGKNTYTEEPYSHVQGKYNLLDTEGYAHIVGNGEEGAPSNAHTLDWSGNAWFAGKVIVGEENDELAIKPIYETSTLEAANWNANIYSFETKYSSDSYDIEILLNGDTITLKQKEAYQDAEIVGSISENKIKCLGDIPTIDIPIVIKAVKK